MAANLNKILIAGNLTRKPGIEYLNSGTAVCKFVVAVNDQWRDKAGELQKTVEFFKIVAWGKMGENCAEYLDKGSPVFVIGKVKSRTFEGEDGQKKFIVEIVAEEVQFLGQKKAQTGGTSNESAA